MHPTRWSPGFRGLAPGEIPPVSIFHMYNTIMAVAAGVSLLLLVDLGRRLYLGLPVALDGSAVGLGALGVILFSTGLHMTLTWPLPRVAGNCCQQDNVVFGEPCLAFGVILIGGAILLWRARGVAAPGDVPETGGRALAPFTNQALPLAWFGAAMGCALVAMAIAGVNYKLFAAPPSEPISGRFANHPLIEATFISVLWAIIGVGAILLPFALMRLRRQLLLAVGGCFTIGGLVLTGFGILNYFTHIGLIIHTQGGH
jgi:hypothetical protein